MRGLGFGGVFGKSRVGAGFDWRRTLGDLPQLIDVAVFVDGSGQRLYPFAGVWVFGRGHQPQVTLGQMECIALGQRAQHRQTGSGLDGLGHDLAVALAGDLVDDDAFQREGRVKALETQDGGSGASAHLAGVQHQHYRRSQQLGNVGRAANLALAGAAVIQPHHPLDDRRVSFGSAAGK